MTDEEIAKKDEEFLIAEAKRLEEQEERDAELLASIEVKPINVT